MRFDLPLPPSVNSYLKRDWQKTQTYKSWQVNAGWSMKLARFSRPQGFPKGTQLSVSIVFERRGDIDNRVKPLLDLLQNMGVLTDDKDVVRLLVTFGDVTGCVVTIEPITANHELLRSTGKVAA